MATEPTYSSKTARAVLDVSYRVLDYWERTGVLVPTGPAAGSGTQRRYSRLDLMRGLVFEHLTAFRLQGDELRAAASSIVLLGADEFTDWLVVARDGRAFKTANPGETIVFVSGGLDVALVVDLSVVPKRIDVALALEAVTA